MKVARKTTRRGDNFDLARLISPSFRFVLASSSFLFIFWSRARFHSVVVAGDAANVIANIIARRGNAKQADARCSVAPFVRIFLIIYIRAKRGAVYARSCNRAPVILRPRITAYLSFRSADGFPSPFLSHFSLPALSSSIILARVLTNFKRSDSILQEIRSFPARFTPRKPITLPRASHVRLSTDTRWQRRTKKPGLERTGLLA